MGTVRLFEHYQRPEHFSARRVNQRPAHKPVTQTVSVPLRVKPLGLFQKLSFGQVRFESSKSGFGF